ncbi:MAG: succinate dehydrogenase/fumarate reductase cytochrome b subunit [Gammaproteobacteria bacterium]|jgi:succinate dehydrogenase/fumarate reductase cytochrome b subunit
METQAVVQSAPFWQRIQAITGLIFALFVFAHLANIVLAIAGPAASNRFQETARTVYQAPLIEILLLGVILPTHIFAGFRCSRIRRASGGVSLSSAQRWHRGRVGIYMHAAAVRLPSLLR